MSDPTKWEKITPKRLDNMLDSLRKLTRTGARDYEPIPQDDARELVRIVQEAVTEFVTAYTPYLGLEVLEDVHTPPAPSAAEPAAPEAQSTPGPGPLDNPLAISFFVNQIPKEHLQYWTAHLASRVADEWERIAKS